MRACVCFLCAWCCVLKVFIVYHAQRVARCVAEWWRVYAYKTGDAKADMCGSREPKGLSLCFACVHVCMCACVHGCMCACVRACVCARVRACVCAFVYIAKGKGGMFA